MGKREIERIRRICLALPESGEKVAWGEATWRVAGKMFAMTDGLNPHHAGHGLSLWLKSDFDTQAMLVESAPKRFFVPPYQGKAGWVAARLDRSTDWGELAELVEEAWRRAAPPRLTRRS